MINYIENLSNAAGGNNKASRYSGYSPYYGHFQGIYGAGGLASNLKDLIQFAKCLIAEDGSTELGRAVMESFKDQYEAKDSEFPLGRVSVCLPWGLYLVNGEKVFFHPGKLYGYTTLFSVDVKNKKAMIILNNNRHTDNSFDKRFFNGLMIDYYFSIP